MVRVVGVQVRGTGWRAAEPSSRLRTRADIRDRFAIEAS
jgi:hypothetical protein